MNGQTIVEKKELGFSIVGGSFHPPLPMFISLKKVLERETCRMQGKEKPERKVPMNRSTFLIIREREKIKGRGGDGTTGGKKVGERAEDEGM